jgi:protein-S-isoprenylcysteine O-methyltransferase Ste14
MAIIVEGRLMTFIIMVVTFAAMYYYMSINKEEEYTIKTCQQWKPSQRQ